MLATYGDTYMYRDTDVLLQRPSPRSSDSHVYCRVLGSVAVTTRFFDICLLRLVFEHPTFRLRAKRSNRQHNCHCLEIKNESKYIPMMFSGFFSCRHDPLCVQIWSCVSGLPFPALSAFLYISLGMYPKTFRVSVKRVAQ